MPVYTPTHVSHVDACYGRDTRFFRSQRDSGIVLSLPYPFPTFPTFLIQYVF